MKKIYLLFISFIILITLTACSNKSAVNKLDEIKEKGKLSLAVSPDYPPYEFYVAENGSVKIVGADIQLAQEVAKKLGVELEIVQLSFDSLLPALTSGRVDMVISGMNPNKERRQVVDFSDIYYVSGSAFIVRQDDKDITSIDDLKTKKIGVQKGTIQEKALLDDLKISQENIQSLADVPSVLQDLINKNVDVVFLAEDVSQISLNKYPSLKISSFKLEKDAELDGMAIAFSKGNNAELISAVNEVIKKQNSENIFAKELEKYAALAAKIQ
ncbi:MULTISPECIES: transporter substrate-binding domain-containing protein [unclassified Gemella]|uniref:transporter substrate-binding domain-containing protein n=1 Tax=unclassified Gemella TaxID=2624949 RepID=UPI001C050F2E|nr:MULTISPECIES: transporter substrate-binding domain-containing protein [unclassified Gemella]MBU0278915.1 transporter substrate-binding domain-containing protein [Gemella sp. zg-1178]QWQ38471.1 transporter substrate-binding domain-containing protein [Gemella sp. zg-570]